MQAAFGSGDKLRRGLKVHDVDIIFADMLFQLRRQFWPFGVLDRNEVLNAHGIKHLTAKTFSDNTGADTLARRINRGRSARWTAADDQNFKWLLCCDLFRSAGNGAGVELGHNLREVHTALAEGFTIQVNGRDSHDLAGLYFFAEHRAIDCDMADAWIERGHDVDSLNNVRAILARQRKECFETEVAFKRLHRIEQLGLFLGRVSARVEQRENQRCEFMP